MISTRRFGELAIWIETPLAQLYREFAPRIHRFIEYRTRNRELAEDLTNQVFMQALRAIGRYQHRSIPRIHGMAVQNRAQRRRRPLAAFAKLRES